MYIETINTELGQIDPKGNRRVKPAHVKARLKFANGHLGDPEESWEKVMWSDETKIELFGHNSTKRVLEEEE